MSSRALGAALSGVDGLVVEVEVRLSSQLPRVDVVGLPEAAVRESAARVRGAIASAGLRFPDRRITVNLAPAGLRKGGAGLDLPIAVAILAAGANIEAACLDGRALIGELALDGRLRPVTGALAMVMALRAAGVREVIAPAANTGEMSLAPDVEVRIAEDLVQVLRHLHGDEPLPACGAGSEAPEPPERRCLSEVRGQASAKRALEVAAAGGHALLLQGPPGSGKSMLAQRLPALLPPLSPEERLAATRIHGAAGLLTPDQPVVWHRPFRAPHHTASTAGLLGGGSPPRPGEISLAHCGVLLLDELPEFDRRSLEALRQVLEDRCVRISRARASCVFPAHFQLVAACNPCPCGWYRSGARDCRCDDAAIQRYRRRLSGPLLDRIDLHVRVPPVAWRDLDARPPRGAEGSAAIAARVEDARARQRARGIAANALIPDAQLDGSVGATSETRTLLGRAVERLSLSARAARRLLRVARTIADLSAAQKVEVDAMAEALAFRGDESMQ